MLVAFGREVDLGENRSTPNLRTHKGAPKTKPRGRGLDQIAFAKALCSGEVQLRAKKIVFKVGLATGTTEEARPSGRLLKSGRGHP